MLICLNYILDSLHSFVCWQVFFYPLFRSIFLRSTLFFLNSTHPNYNSILNICDTFLCSQVCSFWFQRYGCCCNFKLLPFTTFLLGYFPKKDGYCWQGIKCNNQAINQGCMLHYIKRQIKTTIVARSHLLTNVKLMIKKIEFPWQLVFLQLHAAIKEPSKTNLHLLLIQKCSRQTLRNL